MRYRIGIVPELPRGGRVRGDMMDESEPARAGAAARRRSTLLIILGLRVFYRTIAQGTFHCRRCGGDRPYRHRAGRRWFTVFFVPLSR